MVDFGDIAQILRSSPSPGVILMKIRIQKRYVEAGIAALRIWILNQVQDDEEGSGER
jgi:hypothetical protein